MLKIQTQMFTWKDVDGNYFGWMIEPLKFMAKYVGISAMVPVASWRQLVGTPAVNLENYTPSKEPVLIVENGDHHVVVDGMHRLSWAAANNVEFVDGIVIPYEYACKCRISDKIAELVHDDIIKP